MIYPMSSRGTFISDGTSRIIPVGHGVDYFKLVNGTAINERTNGKGVIYEWYPALGDNDGFVTYYSGTPVVAMARLASIAGGPKPGMTFLDTTKQNVSNAYNITGTTAAVNPVITVANVAADLAGLARVIPNRTVIRLSGAALPPSIRGIDYTVTAVDYGARTMTLGTHGTALPIGGAGSFRIVSYDWNPMWYPETRTVINITQAAQAVCRTSVIHGYKVGQRVRMHVPVTSGMVQLDNYDAIIVAVTAQTFTINVDTTAFTAFRWPLVADLPYQLPTVVPYGADGSLPNLRVFDGAVENKGFVGMLLSGPTDLIAPCGQNGDFMYWYAEKSPNL